MTNVPWSDIPDSSVFPEDAYLFEIAEMDVVYSQTGKKMVAAEYRCLEPADYAGWPHFENYVIGTEDDPEADTAKSWKRLPAINFKRCLSKAGVALEGTLEDACAAAKGNRVVFTLVQTVDEREGRYKGTVRNRVSRCYAPGEISIGGDRSETSARPSTGDGPSAQAPRAQAGVGKIRCSQCGDEVPRATLVRHQQECLGAKHAKAMSQQR